MPVPLRNRMMAIMDMRIGLSRRMPKCRWSICALMYDTNVMASRNMGLVRNCIFRPLL